MKRQRTIFNRISINRILLPVLGILQIAALASFPAAAQNFPTRPINVIYSNAPGTAPDVLARFLSIEASKILGQPIIYENRPGANGRLGFNALKAANGDAHTIWMVNDALVVAQPIIDPKWNIEPGKDYEPVSALFASQFVLASSTKMPFRDLKSLIAYAKANPGKLNFAMSQGSTSQFVSERFMKTVGINATLIPYKGGELGLNATLGGQTDMLFSTATAKSAVDSGRLIPIVTTGQERWKLFPGAPSMHEAGYSFSASVSYILLAPIGTPQPVLAKINKAYDDASRVPEVMKRTEDIGHRSTTNMSPAEVTAFIKSEIEVWTPVIRAAGIKMD